MKLLDKVKLSMRISTKDFDEELGSLIKAALSDLSSVGICNPEDGYKPFTENNVDDLVGVAVCTYVRINFGSPENYDRLKKSYDEQKAQLKSCSKYTKYDGDK